MEILKQGSPKDTKKFICTACGCEWLANDSEYFYDWSTYDIPAVCQCPTCSRVIREHYQYGSTVLDFGRDEMCRTCANYASDDGKCIHKYTCTPDGYKRYKACDRHELD